MSQLLMDLNSEALTSLVEDFPANLTPLQEAARRLVTSVICGEKSSALWGKRNPDGSWERTSQDCLALNLDDSSGEWSMTWPRWGTAWDGLVMEHPTPERFTVAIESLSLGTPTSRDWKGAGRPGQLPTQMLPTRAASQMGKPIRPLAPSELDGSHGTMLVGAIGAAMNLPTPRSCSAMGAAINPNAEFPNLETVIAQSVAATGESGEFAQRLGLAPEFVEAMMGFPIGWTNLKH
jgi:hypothetical protein